MHQNEPGVPSGTQDPQHQAPPGRPGPATAAEPAGRSGDAPSAPAPEWEQRVEALWAAFDEYDPAGFRAAMAALAGELPAGHPVAAFETASAHDATDQEAEAELHYRRALAAGLSGSRRRQAVIQLASTLRILGRPEEAVTLLVAERNAESDDSDDAVDAFLALALADAGRAREATGLALAALAPHLSRYGRSVTHYAEQLTGTATTAVATPDADAPEGAAGAGS